MPTEPKKPKGIPVRLCLLCHEVPRWPPGVYCRACEAHQQRAAAVARRCQEGRVWKRLPPCAVRGKGI